MNAKYTRNQNRRGQALVEYALILALVALVAIVAASILGSAIQRIYGLTTGALGGKHNTAGVIVIDRAQCIADIPSGKTGLEVTGFTTENFADLTISLTGTNVPILSGAVNLFPNGDDPRTGSFIYHPLLSDTEANTGVCPLSVVIQAADKAVAFRKIDPTTNNPMP